MQNVENERLPSGAILFLVMLRPVNDTKDQEISCCGATENYVDALANFNNIIATAQWETVLLVEFTLLQGIVVHSSYILHYTVEYKDVESVAGDELHFIEVVKDYLHKQLSPGQSKKGKA